MFVFYDTSSLLMSISNLKTYLSTSDISFMLCIKLANLLQKKGLRQNMSLQIFSWYIRGYVCLFVLYIWIYGIHWKSIAFDTIIKKVNFSKMIFNLINSLLFVTVEFSNIKLHVQLPRRCNWNMNSTKTNCWM